MQQEVPGGLQSHYQGTNPGLTAVHRRENYSSQDNQTRPTQGVPGGLPSHYQGANPGLTAAHRRDNYSSQDIQATPTQGESHDKPAKDTFLAVPDQTSVERNQCSGEQ